MCPDRTRFDATSDVPSSSDSLTFTAGVCVLGGAPGSNDLVATCSGDDSEPGCLMRQLLERLWSMRDARDLGGDGLGEPAEKEERRDDALVRGARWAERDPKTDARLVAKEMECRRGFELECVRLGEGRSLLTLSRVSQWAGKPSAWMKIVLGRGTALRG